MPARTIAVLLLILALPAGARDPLRRLTLTVDKTEREALIHAPATAKAKLAPLVFVFHGHGGNLRQAALSFSMHTHWPDAITVYPQGLPTPGRLTDSEGKRAGWQHAAGDQDDRDLKFFDALLTRLKGDYKVDPRRIYSTGHSNGGAFTYLLWAGRSDHFAAFAPSAAVMRRADKLQPKPAMHLAGQQDALVKYQWQELMMRALRRRNGCDAAGQSYGPHATLYPSKAGTPVVTFIHPGGHEFPRAAVPLIVKFFQQHSQK